MKRIIKISFILLILFMTVTLFKFNTVKAVDEYIDVVDEVINPSGSYNHTKARYLQKELNSVIGSKLITDGDVGTKTIKAIKTFQKAYGLTANGIVNNDTLVKLNTAYKCKKIIVSGTTVNIRDNPGFNSNVIGKVKKGDILSYYGNVKIGNYTWYKVWYNTGFAYIISTYTCSNFIEIDIVSQTIRLYNNKALILDTPITTGRLDGTNETKTGYFSIIRMDYAPNATTKMMYWIGFYSGQTGQGIHDSPWRKNYQNFSYYGGKVYKNLNYPAGNQNSGSHGCVNVPREKMKIIYNTIKPLYDSGVNVVIYSH